MQRLASLGVALAACSGTTKSLDSGTEPLIDPAVEPYIWSMVATPEVPADPTNRWADDDAAAWFGRFLYFDTRLSGAGTFSCATCHDFDQGTGDGLAVSEAAGTPDRHTPAIWNVADQRWLFWDGRCDSLWCQAAGPIEADAELNLSRVELARVISTEPDLSAAYASLFGAPPDVSDTRRFPDAARPVADASHPEQLAWAGMSAADQDAVTEVLVHVSKAIAAYERTLRTTDSRVDRFIRALDAGDTATARAALTETERRGLELFAGEGECVFCHSGNTFSNKEFHNLGLPESNTVDFLDTGRYDGISAVWDHELNGASRWSDDPTGASADRLDRIAQTSEQLGQFKTPSLRGVAQSAPYMHGGHFDTLEAVVAFYADPPAYEGPGHREELVVARGWDADDQAALVAFLAALSPEDPPDAALVTAPPPADPLTHSPHFAIGSRSPQGARPRWPMPDSMPGPADCGDGCGLRVPTPSSDTWRSDCW